MPGAGVSTDRQVELWRRRYLVPAAGVFTVDGSSALSEPSDDGLYNVGSLAKSVTAWGVLELADRRLLDLDRPANHYLPDWKLRYDDGTESGANLRQLLSHTGGTGVGLPRQYTEPTSLPNIEDSLADERVIAASPPGSSFAYSNSGYAVVQAVIERVTGCGFADVMQDLVLQPLGMTASTFDAQATDEGVHRPHRRRGVPVPSRHSCWSAAGGLYCTASDVGRFVSALIQAGNGGSVGPVTAERLDEVVSTSTAGLGVFGLRNGGYGLGHAWTRGLGGRLLIANQGSNQGWKALFAAVPERDSGIVVVTNSDTGMLLIAEAVTAWLAEAGPFPWPCRLLTIARVATVGATATLLACAGRSLLGERHAGRWCAPLALVAVAAVMSSERPLDKAGLGPVQLGRLLYPWVPGILGATSRTQPLEAGPRTPL